MFSENVDEMSQSECSDITSSDIQKQYIIGTPETPFLTPGRPLTM